MGGKVIEAASDGACSGNPGPGGWGALLRFEDGSVEEFGGYEPSTTNNRMELQAALAILERLKQLSIAPDLKIRTDSKYLIDGFSKWIKGWKKNGWKTSNGKPVLNKDLWIKLDKARLVDVSLEYVKGHSGDRDNDRVDQIAVSFSKKISPQLRNSKFSTFDASVYTFEKAQTKDLFDTAPVNLQKLSSRLELVDFFAVKGFSLTLNEVAELINQPKEELRNRKEVWYWRDWLFEPLSDGKWRLQRHSTPLIASEESMDE